MKFTITLAVIAAALLPMTAFARQGAKTGHYDPTIEDSFQAKGKLGKRPLRKTSGYEQHNPDQSVEVRMLCRTSTLTRLAFAIQGMGGSPSETRRAMSRLKAIDTKVGAVLDNERLTDATKRQKLESIQSEGLLKLTNELGSTAPKLKAAWITLGGDAFRTKLKGIAGRQFPAIQSRLNTADRLAGSVDSFFIGGWGDVGLK